MKYLTFIFIVAFSISANFNSKTPKPQFGSIFTSKTLRGNLKDLDLASSIVKLTVGFDEAATGIALGSSDEYFYILTALHTFNQEDGQRLNTAEVNFSRSQSYTARVAKTNTSLDLALIRIPLHNISKRGHTYQDLSAPPETRMSAFFIERENTRKCIFNKDVYVIGFVSGSYSYTPDVLNTEIIAYDYYGDDVAYRLSPSGLDGGHSGAPVFNKANDLIGIVIKKNDVGTACKALRLDKALEWAEGFGWIKNKLVQYNPMVGVYKATNARLKDGMECDLSGFPLLRLKGDGSASGLANGTYCIQEGGSLTFHGTTYGENRMVNFKKRNSSIVSPVYLFHVREEFKFHIDYGYNFGGGGGSGQIVTLQSSEKTIFLTPQHPYYR